MHSQVWFPKAAPEISYPDAPEARLPPDMAMLAHISMRGDVRGQAGSWLGAVGSGLPLEGIMMAPAAEGPPQLAPALEYQCVYPGALKTPWMSAGKPCGSAGLSLRCLGLRFRLGVESAPFFECAYDVTFVDGTRLSDIPSPEIARAPSGACVEAVRLQLRPRRPVPLLVLSDLDRRPPPPGGESPADDPLIRLRLLSPAFSTRPPTIRNPELIPFDTRNILERSWERRVFSPRPVSLRVRDNACVIKGMVSERAADPSARRINGVSLLCASQGALSLGQYLAEIFPQAWLIQRLPHGQRLTYLVRRSGILPAVTDSLVLIGVSLGAVASIDDAPIVCDRLLMLDGLTFDGDYQSPLCAEALVDLAGTLPAGPYRKLLVRRPQAKERPANLEVIELLLRCQGFVAVDPDRMTLAEQIVLFKGATTVVGVLGAPMTGIGFCPGGARVVALAPAETTDTSLWFLCQHRRHDYIEIRGQDAGSTRGFTIDDADLAFLATL